ncbi:fibronectin type III domain-containing protein [Candidatus Daviesbacteria bacterium]|nr:fibronectin type III domain-containing protein [Candidatus Daviesbacteria bacterium]
MNKKIEGTFLKIISAIALFIIFFEFTIVFLTPQANAQCAAGTPANLTATPGTTPGTMMLRWNQATSANRYALVFGHSSRNYNMGSLNIDGGSDTTYMVTHLVPGNRYFFQVWAFCDNNGPATASNEVSAMVPGTAITTTSTGPIAQGQTTVDP